jgi:hypothetical protein
MNSICFNCGKEMKVKKSGVMVSKSYSKDFFLKIYNGGLLECCCGNQIITNFANSYERPNEEGLRNKIIWII